MSLRPPQQQAEQIPTIEGLERPVTVPVLPAAVLQAPCTGQLSWARQGRGCVIDFIYFTLGWFGMFAGIMDLRRHVMAAWHMLLGLLIAR